MSLLQKFGLLPRDHQQRIFQCYRTSGFPHEIDLFLVRQKCSGWIEGNLWNNNINPDKPEDEEKIKQWFQSFSAQLQTCIHGTPGDEPFKLTTSLTYFQKHVQARQLFRILKNCLNQELLTHSQMRTEKIIQLEKYIEQAEGLSRERMQVWNSLVENETQMTTLIDWSSQDPSAAAELEEMRRNYDRFISQKRVEYSGLERRINEIVAHLLQASEQLLSNLREAQREPNYEQVFDGYLGTVLHLKKILHQADLLITNVIQASHHPITSTLVGQRHTVLRLITTITSLLNPLFVHVMSVTRHPDQIIKQDKKFDIDLCCRAPITLKFVDTLPTIKVIVINDREAANLYRAGNTGQSPELPRPSGDVTFERSSHIFEEGRLTITLHDMKVPTRPTDPRNRPTPVLRQKFYLFFFCTGTINDIPYTMWTLSNPFVYTTNVSQVLEASCTIFWDTYLKQETDQFNIPDEVPVSTMTQALANYVQVETNASWSLAESQRRYLAQKILQTNVYPITEATISRNQFENVRDPLTSVPFWEWFSATIKLIKEHLAPYWAEGLIAGFMHRQQAEELLLYNKPGTFVLRCSDTCGAGGLSITWNEQGKGPCSVQPLTDKCFQIKNLTERLHDITNFVEVLYPTINISGFSWTSKPKKQAFPYSPGRPVVVAERFEQRVRAPGMLLPVKPYIRTGMIWSLFQGVPRQEQAELQNCVF